MYQELTQGSAFYLDRKAQYFVSNTGYLITGESLNYLLVLLNSKFIEFCFRSFYSISLGLNGLRWLKQYIENLPIMKFKNNQIQQQIIAIYRQRDKNNANEIDNKIDNLIYQLYGLTKEEIHLIEKDTIKFRG